MKKLSLTERVAAVAARSRRRKGVFFVLAIVCLLGALTFVGMSVDLGMITVTKTRMQAAADAAALASAQEIVAAMNDAGASASGGIDLDAVSDQAAVQARAMAANVCQLNGYTIDPEVDVIFGRRTLAQDGETPVYAWNAKPYNCVQVVISLDNDDPDAPDAKMPLLFAKMGDGRKANIHSQAVAYIGARDIVSVLDYSGSMAYDSILDSDAADRLSLATIENSLDDIWDALRDSGVTYSDDPSTAKFPSAGYGKITSYEGVEYQGSTNSVYDWLELEWEEVDEDYYLEWGSPVNGWYYTYYDGNHWRANANSLQKYRGNRWRNYNSDFPGSVTYHSTPFPQEGKNNNGYLNGKPGSNTSESLWKDYIEYVQTDSDVNQLGYRHKYGFRTLMSFLIEVRMQNHYSEDLWRAPIYPFHSMKSGMTVLTGFLQDLQFGDQLGLVTYATTSRTQTGLNDDGAPVTTSLNGDLLSTQYDKIDIIQHHKQPGHYDRATGLGFGIDDGLTLLENEGRMGARQTLLLMTDGQPNQYPNGWNFNQVPGDWNWDELTDYDGDGHADFTIDENYTGWDSNAKAAMYAFVKVREARQAGVAIDTLSVGGGADQDLMRAIAFATDGIWIHVQGGNDIDTMREQLRAAFGVMGGNVPPARLEASEE